MNRKDLIIVTVFLLVLIFTLAISITMRLQRIEDSIEDLRIKQMGLKWYQSPSEAR